MEQNISNQNNRNTSEPRHAHLICWHSVLSGLFIALFSYMMLSALGLGIGGLTAAHILDNKENGSGLLTGSGVWLGLSAVVSLFLGGYFATRFSNSSNKHAGIARGAVICALFFFLVLGGMGNMLGSLANLSSGNGAFNTGTADAEQAARALGNAGWVIFTTTVLGLLAAVLGGYEGVVGNLKRPFNHNKA